MGYLPGKKLEELKMVQAKIKHKSERWMADIRKKDKSASKFWNHVKLLSSKNDIHQKLLIDEKEKHLEGGHTLAHIHQVIREMLRENEVGKHAPITSVPQKTAERKVSLSNLD